MTRRDFQRGPTTLNVSLPPHFKTMNTPDIVVILMDRSAKLPMFFAVDYLAAKPKIVHSARPVDR